jgi:protein-tyrosine phosphatase
LFIPAVDDSAFDISVYFTAVHKFIMQRNSSGRRCLIHCHGGQNRSVVLALAHLLLTGTFTLGAALTLLVKQRPIILSNQGFRAQLIELALSLNGSRYDLLQL